MGKKKRKKQKKLAKQIDTWTSKHEWDRDDLVLAGLGTLVEAARAGKRKRFEKAVATGRTFAELGVTVMDDTTPSEFGEPVISYAPRGGGWYSVEVDGIEVDRVQGEEAAAGRAGDLLERYAALDAADQRTPETVVRHTGGGWYEVIVNGVPVDRVRGKDDVTDRYGHLFSEVA